MSFASSPYSDESLGRITAVFSFVEPGTKFHTEKSTNQKKEEKLRACKIL